MPGIERSHCGFLGGLGFGLAQRRHGDQEER
jgi:hypothetical protein